VADQHVFMLELERWFGTPPYYDDSPHGVFASYDAAVEYAERFWRCVCKRQSVNLQDITFAISEVPIRKTGKRDPRRERRGLWRWNPEGRAEPPNFIKLKHAHPNAPANWHEKRQSTRHISRRRMMWFCTP